MERQSKWTGNHSLDSGKASMITKAWAIGKSSVIVKWMEGAWPPGIKDASRSGRPARELHGRLATG